MSNQVSVSEVMNATFPKEDYNVYSAYNELKTWSAKEIKVTMRELCQKHAYKDISAHILTFFIDYHFGLKSFRHLCDEILIDSTTIKE